MVTRPIDRTRRDRRHATQLAVEAALFLIATAGFPGAGASPRVGEPATLVAFVVEAGGRRAPRAMDVSPARPDPTGRRRPAPGGRAARLAVSVRGRGRRPMLLRLRRQRRDRLLPRRPELRRRVLRRTRPSASSAPPAPAAIERRARVALQGQRGQAPARLLRHVARALGRIRRMIRASAASRRLSPSAREVVEALEQVVRGPLDLLVAPLGGTVETGDQPHPVHAAEVAVDERVARLRLVGCAFS